MTLQEVALVDDQVTVDEPPLVTLVGEALIEAVGTDGGAIQELLQFDEVVSPYTLSCIHDPPPVPTAILFLYV